MEELQVEPVDEKLGRYKSNWLRHVPRISNKRNPKIILNYRPKWTKTTWKTLEVTIRRDRDGRRWRTASHTGRFNHAFSSRIYRRDAGRAAEPVWTLWKRGRPYRAWKQTAISWPSNLQLQVGLRHSVKATVKVHHRSSAGNWIAQRMFFPQVCLNHQSKSLRRVI